jgi:hypothetical protein
MTEAIKRNKQQLWSLVSGHGNCCRMLNSQFGVPRSRPLSHSTRSCSSIFPVQWSPKTYFSVWFTHKQIALLPLIQLQIITNNFVSIRICSNNNQRMEGGKNLWSKIDALVAVFLHQTEGFPLRILACVVLSTEREQEGTETTKKKEKSKNTKEKRNLDRKKNYDRSIRIMRWEDWITLQKVHITLLCVYRNWLPGGGGTRSWSAIRWRIATSKLPASITVRMASRASIHE